MPDAPSLLYVLKDCSRSAEDHPVRPEDRPWLAEDDPAPQKDGLGSAEDGSARQERLPYSLQVDPALMSQVCYPNT